MSSPWPAKIAACVIDEVIGCYRVDCGPYAWLAAYSGIPGAMDVDTQTTVLAHQSSLIRPQPDRGAACWLQQFALVDGVHGSAMCILEIQDACHGCEKG